MGELIKTDTNNNKIDNNGDTNINNNLAESEKVNLIQDQQSEQPLKMKKVLSKKELKIEERVKIKEIEENLTITKDIRCGITCLQGFANSTTFIIIYGILGATINAASSYFNASISTFEKRFKIPSQNMGIILTGNDVTGLLFGYALCYYAGKKHKPRYMCIGMLCVVSFCVITVLPHLIYGSGTDALALTTEHSFLQTNESIGSNLITEKSLCSNSTGECIKEGSLTPQVILFIGQLMWGIGSPLYNILGLAYMDDNMKRSKTPILMSISYFIKMLGPVGGYVMAFTFLKMYVSPSLHPVITNSDPRWIGAWWLGWIVIGGIMFIFTLLISLFPKQLPDSAVRKIYSEETQDETKYRKKEDDSQASIKDMWVTSKRLMKNKVLMGNTVAGCFYCCGYYPYWTFLPKYLEIQYRVTASMAALITGTVGLVFTAIGILVAGGIVSKFRPRARTLTMFNIFAGVVTMCGVISYIFLGCPQGDEFNRRVSERSMNWANETCVSGCNCEFSKYSPVCSRDGTNITYISPCHAGCRAEEMINDTKVYQNCSCIPTYKNVSSRSNHFFSEYEGGSATMGACPIDCSSQFYMFVAIVCLLKLVGAAAKTTNVLVSVRCVEEKDKSVSMSFGMTALSLFAFIPAPIFFGWIMDQTCILWGKTCAGSGNCWVYDAASLRIYLNYSAAVLLFISNIFDVVVWYYSKDIQIFDEVVGEERKREKKISKDNSNKTEYSKIKTIN